MSQVECEIQDTVLENDNGDEIGGVAVCCKQCDHVEEAFGIGDDSVKYACKQLNENCPEGENNYYFVPGINEIKED